jgi:hypothetical protein
MGLTGVAGGVTGGVGVTGVTGAGVVEVDEPPPHPAKNAMGNTKEARSLDIFMMVNYLIFKKK